MKKPITFLVQCGECEEVFPISLTLTDGNNGAEAVNSLEETCPKCKTLLTFTIPGNLKLNASVIKGFHLPKK